MGISPTIPPSFRRLAAFSAFFQVNFRNIPLHLSQLVTIAAQKKPPPGDKPEGGWLQRKSKALYFFTFIAEPLRLQMRRMMPPLFGVMVSTLESVS